MAAQERGNANAQAWGAAVEAALGAQWQRLGLRQLSGMLVLVYARRQYLVGRMHPGTTSPEATYNQHYHAIAVCHGRFGVRAPAAPSGFRSSGSMEYLLAV